MRAREFWIWPDHNAVKPVGKYLTMTPSNKVPPIHVREVVPIDWEHVWEGIAFNKYTQHVDQPTKEMIKQLVEAQLKGEE